MLVVVLPMLVVLLLLLTHCSVRTRDIRRYGENSLLFHRFYAGSGVCSPTRSAALTGRTPDRECIFGT